MIEVIAYGFRLFEKRNYISVSNHPEGAVLHSRGDQRGESRDISFLLSLHRPIHYIVYTLCPVFFGCFYFPIIYFTKKF